MAAKILHLWSCVPLVLLGLASGCLEFEEQTLTYAYDARTDTLRIFQDYHGIFGTDQTNGLSDGELDQLQSVLATPRTFFFANWIFEFNRPELERHFKQIQTDKDRPADGVAADELAKVETLLRLLLDHVRVENGSFYFDAQRRLSAGQRVTVTRASKIVAALNDWLPGFLREQAAKNDTPAALRAMYERAAKEHRQFLSLRDNELTLRWPLTREEYDKTFSPESAGGKSVERFRRSGGRFAFANDAVVLSVGTPTDRLTALTLPMSEKPYLANAVDAVKQRVPVREQYDAATAAREFLKPAQ